LLALEGEYSGPRRLGGSCCVYRPRAASGHPPLAQEEVLRAGRMVWRLSIRPKDELRNFCRRVAGSSLWPRAAAQSSATFRGLGEDSRRGFLERRGLLGRDAPDRNMIMGVGYPGMSVIYYSKYLHGPSSHGPQP